MMHRNWSCHVDELRNDLERNHKEIKIIDFNFYNVEVFNRCENSNDILLAVKPWENVHPLLKIIPVKWDNFIPYGMLHSPAPSKTVMEFLDAVKTVINSEQTNV